MIKWKKNFRDYSIQTKLMLVYIATMLLILLVNIFVYRNINDMLHRLDQIYASNINLDHLSDSMANVQTGMTNYLNTKTTEAMDDYYKSYQEFANQLDSLSDVITDDSGSHMERNIKNMSEEYLRYADLAVEAKRGRNVEKYKTFYEKAQINYQNITVFINSLNTERFKSNNANYSMLASSLRYMEVVNTFVFMGVAVVNIIIVLIIIGSITRPLRDLSQVANTVADGNYDVEPLQVVSQDEVGVVSATFNQMVVSIRENIKQLTTSMENERILKENELKMETHLKDAQLKYLQAQINPHFLFNTLNAGAQLAMMEDADRTNKYILRVADFFRYNIKKDHDIVSLREELELVDTYIYILNVRFSGEIHYETDVDDSLLNFKVPSMILQPVVENCVNHGIRDMEEPGEISVSVYKEDGNVVINIVDNGVGITEETIDKIMHSHVEKPSKDEKSNGIGLGNVIGRCKLFYETEDVFQISNATYGRGTAVTFLLPIRSEDF